MSVYRKLPAAEPDEFFTPEVGEWGRQKYLRLWTYADIFTTSMRSKHPDLVYLDLFAGAGKAQIKGSNELVLGSPLLALSLKNRFSKYILCEQDPARAQALASRMERMAGGADWVIYDGNVNTRVDEILARIPSRALCLCFADPFSLDLRLTTLTRLSAGRKMDFLVLLAIGMDAARNEAPYTAEGSSRLAFLLGRGDWRPEWLAAKARGIKFGPWVRLAFGKAMKSIGYSECEPHIVRRELDNAPLYDLTLYSKHESLACRFWAQACKYSTDQTSFLDVL
jgi:three-Cys-motif partner protein